jgi:hypothetical protein
MRRSSIIALLLTAFLFAPSAASAAPIRECGNYGWKDGGMRWTYGQIEGAGIFNVTSRRVWCSVARQVARRAYNTYAGGQTWRWKGWRCRILRSAHEFSDTRCTKRRTHIVRWQAAA